MNDNINDNMNGIETIIRQQYDRWATIYDTRWRNYTTNSLQFFKNWAQIPSSATILDVACGTGEFERLLLAESPEQDIVGIDISPQMLTQAQRKLSNYANVRWQIASARSLPFSDRNFDIVVSANAFHFFDHPDLVLAEMRRVLKPTGKLLLLDWCRDDWRCRVMDLVLHVTDPGYRQCYTLAELNTLLQASQFALRTSVKFRATWLWGLMAIEAEPRSGERSGG